MSLTRQADKPQANSCLIWIRTVGVRRQALVRLAGPGGRWRSIHVAKADKALRTGLLEMQPGVPLTAMKHQPEDEMDVSRETRAFGIDLRRVRLAEEACLINRQIDEWQAAPGAAAL